MAMKAGDIVGEHSPEQYAKLMELSRLARQSGKAPRERRMPKLPKKALVLVVALLAVSMGAYAFASITILVPHVPAHGLFLNCASAVPSKPSVLVNSTGFILVTCNGQGLIRALAGTNASANYSLPQPYTDLYIYPAGQDSIIVNRCTDTPAALDLARPVIFGYNGNWSLCSDYGPVGSGGLPGYSIGWTVSG